MIHQVRVIFGDTDQMGVVYYANYLRYFERARTEFLRAQGVDVRHWMKLGLLFTVVDAQVSYHAPAHYDDVLAIGTRVTDVRRVRFSLAHEITRPADRRPIVTGTTTLACVGPDGRPAKFPDPVARALKGAAGG